MMGTKRWPSAWSFSMKEENSSGPKVTESVVKSRYLYHGPFNFSRRVLGDGKEDILIHVVDVSPYRLERDVKVLVRLDYGREVRDVVISPSALMEPERPILLHGRQTDGVDVIRNDLRWGWAGVEGQIDHSANGPPCQRFLA
jgi:hypothetical protein